MNVLAGLAVGALNGNKLLKRGDEVKRKRNYAIKRRRSLVKRVFNKERRLHNLDYTTRSFPLKQYLYLCTGVSNLIHTKVFLFYIKMCILLAVILVGADTYTEYTDSPVSVVLDNFVIYSFLMEAVFKILSEGAGPHLYFIGPEGMWNVVDFAIVIVSLLPQGLSQVRVLRIIR